MSHVWGRTIFALAASARTIRASGSAIVEHPKQVIFLEDDDVAFVEDGALSIHRIKRDGADNSDQTRAVHQLNMELQQIMRGDFKTFMQKEICEQPDSIVNTMRGRLLPDGRIVLGGIKDYLSDIKRCRRLIMIACGTSYNSAIAVLQAAWRSPDRRDEHCRQLICRESHCGVHINAGPEVGVASTKAYTSQILALVMFALCISDDRISMSARRLDIIREMHKLSDYVRDVLKLDAEVLQIAEKMHQEKSVLIMGRGYNFATCLEGALKIKELSYMHCEGIMSGELKHGPLAMVDENLCTIMIICSDHVYKKSLNALEQVRARGGRPIVIADTAVPEADLEGVERVLRVPKTVDCLQSILSVIPLQLLSYHIAEQLGLNVDRPRNLAKSVTVE